MSNESLIEECKKLDRISALRLYRERTGCSLRDAADTLFPAKKAPLTFPDPVAWQGVVNGNPINICAFRKPKERDGQYIKLYTEQQVRAMFAERGIK